MSPSLSDSVGDGIRDGSPGDDWRQRYAVYSNPVTERDPVYSNPATERHPQHSNRVTERDPVYSNPVIERYPQHSNPVTEQYPLHSNLVTERHPVYSNASFEHPYQHHISLENLPWNAFGHFPEEAAPKQIPEDVSPSPSLSGSEVWHIDGSYDEVIEASLYVLDLLPGADPYEFHADTFVLRPPEYENRVLIFLKHQLRSAKRIISFDVLTASPDRNYLSPLELSVEGYYSNDQGHESRFILCCEPGRRPDEMIVWPSDNEYLIVRAFKRFVRETREPLRWIEDESLRSGWKRLRKSIILPEGQRRRASFPGPPLVSQASGDIMDSWQNDTLSKARGRLSRLAGGEIGGFWTEIDRIRDNMGV
jgi:hypothetical protein